MCSFILFIVDWNCFLLVFFACSEFYLNWNQLEHKFCEHFFSGENEAKLLDLTSVRQGRDEPASDYFWRFKDIKNQCYNLTISEKDLVELAFKGLRPYLKEKLEGF